MAGFSKHIRSEIKQNQEKDCSILTKTKEDTIYAEKEKELERSQLLLSNQRGKKKMQTNLKYEVCGGSMEPITGATFVRHKTK